MDISRLHTSQIVRLHYKLEPSSQRTSLTQPRAMLRASEANLNYDLMNLRRTDLTSRSTHAPFYRNHLTRRRRLLHVSAHEFLRSSKVEVCHQPSINGHINININSRQAALLLVTNRPPTVTCNIIEAAHH